MYFLCVCCIMYLVEYYSHGIACVFRQAISATEIANSGLNQDYWILHLHPMGSYIILHVTLHSTLTFNRQSTLASVNVM